MPLLIDILLTAAAIATLLASVVVFVQVLAALCLADGKHPGGSGERRPLAIVVPAHDEAAVIAASLATLVPELSAADRLLVVADNCSDSTAALAAAAGAQVIERTHATLRGKGFALDFAIQYLAAQPPAVVIILDADCQAAVGSIDTLARVCIATDQPVQGLYLMRSPPAASPLMRMAEFAWIFKGRVRALGMHRLGLPCRLMGSGMAFPWHRIKAAQLATTNIVEDLQLGVELASAGTFTRFCPEALITSEFPVSREGSSSQRRRWEHGHLSVIVREAPALFWAGIKARSAGMIALAFDVAVPPLALLLLQLLAAWVLGIVLFAVTGLQAPVDLATLGLLLLALSVFLSWNRYGRGVVSLGSMALAPFYALSKLPLYLKFLFAREQRWVRSKRD